VITEKLCVKGSQALEIEAAILVSGGFRPGPEIVVHTDHPGSETLGSQVCCQHPCKCGFSTAGWTGYHYYAFLRESISQHAHDLDNSAVLVEMTHHHHLSAGILPDSAVQHINSVNSHPADVLFLQIQLS